MSAWKGSGSNRSLRVELTGSSEGEGYAQATLNTATASTINRAAGKGAIVVQVESGEVRVRTDGTAPTSTVGQVVGAGFEQRYAVASLQVIEVGASAVIQTWSE